MVQIAAPLNGNGSHAIEHLMIWQTDEHKTKKIKELTYIYPNTTILNSFTLNFTSNAWSIAPNQRLFWTGIGRKKLRNRTVPGDDRTLADSSFGYSGCPSKWRTDFFSTTRVWFSLKEIFFLFLFFPPWKAVTTIWTLLEIKNC